MRNLKFYPEKVRRIKFGHCSFNREKLQALALEEERVRVEELSLAEFAKLPEIIDEFAETIDEVGPNPFKDL